MWSRARLSPHNKQARRPANGAMAEEPGRPQEGSPPSEWGGDDETGERTAPWAFEGDALADAAGGGAGADGVDADAYTGAYAGDGGEGADDSPWGEVPVRYYDYQEHGPEYEGAGWEVPDWEGRRWEGDWD
ncbi:MAG: hypothetical protein ACRDZX_00520, partial [Acidimicrobiales bacterium]